MESALDAKGLIDRNRVGLAGFSRTGQHVQYAVTFSSISYAAALIADASQTTPWAYFGMYGFGRQGMALWDDPQYMSSLGGGAVIGAPLFGEGIKLWLERSPAFNLDRIRAPLRFEHHNVRMPPGAWDTYVVLKRQHRPVELVHFPLGPHGLVTPYERFTSQQGTVDWFDFWLNGRERTEPYPGTPETKAPLAEQYERWRVLRAERDALNDVPLPPLRDWSWTPRPAEAVPSHEAQE